LAVSNPADTIDDVRRTIQLMARGGYPGFNCSGKSLSRLEAWGQPHPGLSTPGQSTNSGLSERRLVKPKLSEPGLLKPGLLKSGLLKSGSSKTGTSGQDTSAPSLADIRAALGDCRRCNLSAGRRQIVFGSGNPTAKLVFVGEGPGYEEDRKGEPFVGPAGQLLTKIIGAIGMTRDAVYILNVVKCRPPKNRNPLPDEVAACTPFMDQQIRSIKPDYICALGKFAAQTLLKTDRPISRLRGQFFDYQGIQLIPTFHPSYLLRNPEKKREVWQDMQKLMAAMKRRPDALE